MHAHRSGFTLLEIMFVLASASIVIGVVLGTTTYGWRAWATCQAQSGLQRELGRTRLRVLDEVSGAGVHTIANVPADGAWYGSLTFRVPIGLSGTQIQWSPDTIQYSLHFDTANTAGLGGRLIRMQGQTQEVIARDIRSFLVRRLPLAPRVLEFEIHARKETLDRNCANGYLDDTARLKVQLRN